MAGAIIGALRVTLGLDTAQFDAGSKRAQSSAKALGTKLTAALHAPRNAVTGLAGAVTALGGALALNEFAGAAKRAFDFADAIADLSDRTGASTKLIQEFRYAAQMSGSGVDTADQALEKFSRTLGLAQGGSKAQIALFKSLGVTSTDFDTAFRQTLSGLAKLPSIAERNATSLQVFGKSATTLVGLMGQGTEGYDRLASAAQRLGIVIEEDVLRNAGQANDKLDEMRMILDAQFANAVAKNADELVGMANAMLKVAGAVMEMWGAMSRAKHLMVLDNPNGTRVGAAINRLVGGPNTSATAARQNAVDALLATREGRQELANRNGAARRALASGQTGNGLGADGTGIPDNPSAIAAERRRLEAERATIWQAEMRARQASASSPPPRSTGGTLPTSAGGGGSSGKAAADAKRAADEAKRRAEEARRNRERFDDDMLGLEREQYRRELEATTDTDARAALQGKLLDLDRQEEEERLRRRVQDGELTAVQARKLKLGQNSNRGLEEDAIERERLDTIRRDELATADAARSLQADLLRGQLDGARTEAERRRLQLQLLDIEYDRQRAALEAVLALSTSTKAEKEIAQARLDQLATLKAGDRQSVERQTMGPMAAYLDSLPQSADELNEAYQRVAVDGLGALNDGLVDAITGARSLGDVFKQVSNQIIADLLRIAIRKAIVGSLGNALGSLFGGGINIGSDTPVTLGDDFMSGGGSSPFASLPGAARGGSFMAGGYPGIDRNVLSLNGMPKVRVSANERIRIEPANANAPVARVEIVEREGFASRVVGLSDGVSVTRISESQRRAGMRGRQRLA